MAYVSKLKQTAIPEVCEQVPSETCLKEGQQAEEL